MRPAQVRRAFREPGATVVFVMLDQEKTLVLLDRIAIFNRGRIEQAGSGL